MGKGYKVRLPEGIEVGPLDLEMLRSWYEQGMVRKDSPVQATGSARWVRLMDAEDLRDWRAPAAGEPQAGRQDAGAADDDETRPARWRSAVAAVLFLALAAGAVFALFSPDRFVPALRRAPWREIALGAAGLGLLLLPGWELARRLVRVLVLVLTWALFPLLGILWVDGVRGRGLLAIAAAWVMGSGLFALLAARLSGWQSALSLLATLAGGAGVAHFGLLPEDPVRNALQQHASPARRFADAESGMALALPAGWVLLGSEGDAQAPRRGAALAHPELHATGRLEIDSAAGAMTPDQVLDLALRSRPLLRAAARSSVVVAGQEGRQASGPRDGDPEGAGPRDTVVAWKDGWTAVILEASFPPERPADAQQAFAELLRGVSRGASPGARRDAAVKAVVEESPHLNSRAAELVLAAGPLPPPAAFRRAWDLAERGRAALDPAEARELEELLSRAQGALRKPERARLAEYLAHVRLGQATGAGDDIAASELMRGAVLRLPEPERALLQALYEKAVAAGAAAGATPPAPASATPAAPSGEGPPAEPPPESG
jgi:hypothetical protein